MNDNIVTAAQLLIQQKYPQYKGLQSPILGETLAFDVHPDGVKFVQVLNVHQSHWITVTSIGCDTSDHQVKVYDSLPSTDVPLRTKQQIGSMLFSNFHEIKMLFPNVQLQQNSNDFGLFALAFAVSLCAGQDPLTTTYIQSKLRSHLILCFERNEINPFPAHRQKRRIAKKPVVTSSFKIYCICRLPEGGKMIECERCLNWFHKECVSTVIGNWRKKNNVQWFCHKCK